MRSDEIDVKEERAGTTNEEIDGTDEPTLLQFRKGVDRKRIPGGRTSFDPSLDDAIDIRTV